MTVGNAGADVGFCMEWGGSQVVMDEQVDLEPVTKTCNKTSNRKNN